MSAVYKACVSCQRFFKVLSLPADSNFGAGGTILLQQPGGINQIKIIKSGSFLQGFVASVSFMPNMLNGVPLMVSRDSICPHETLNLSATTIPGATYTWTGPNNFASTAQNPMLPNFTSIGLGQYMVEASVDGCTGYAFVDANFNGALETGNISWIDENCGESNGKILVTGLETNRSYAASFKKDNVLQPHVSFSADAAGVLQIEGLGPGVYDSIIITSILNCTSKPLGPVTIGQIPPDPAIVVSPQYLCIHELAEPLTATGSNLLWYYPDTFVIGSNTAPILATNNADSTVYYVSQTVAGCESARMPIEVIVHPPIEPSFTLSSHTICEGQELLALNTTAAQPQRPFSVIWNFWDGITDAANTVSHIYERPGEYPVSLRVSDTFGCNEPIVDTVTVVESYCCKDFNINMPNAFTPNQDGHNDYFGFLNKTDFKIIDFHIYNRWGAVVFEANNVGECWDGTFNNGKAETGVYYYTITVESRCSLRKTVVVKGDVTLIR